MEPLRILVAPDKFKGTLTGRAAAVAIAEGWRRARPTDTVEIQPITDGGDGFGRAMAELLGAASCVTKTVDAAHRRLRARWWWVPRSRTAIIESAEVVGLAQLPRGRFHPFDLDTFGLGEVFRAAARRRPREVLIGIGGSATNDGGFGVAVALGWKFFDGRGGSISTWKGLRDLQRVEAPKVSFDAGRIVVAVDVQNPLNGAKGATRVYGPQKGLTPKDFRIAEASLRQLSKVMKRQYGKDFSKLRGAGAAGGLGFGLAAFLRGQLEEGFELFAAQAGLDKRLRECDVVLTGEGALDISSLMGKGVGRLAALARDAGRPCVALCGSSKLSVRKRGLFSEAHALMEITSIRSALAKPAYWLEQLAFRVARAWNAT